MKLQAMNVSGTMTVCAALVLVCTNVGFAQLPELKEIPHAASAEAKAKLEPERKRLASEIVAIRAGWGEHEKKCRGVVAGSSEHTACLSSRDALVARRAQLHASAEAFHKTFASVLEADIRQIEAQESALSQAIQDGLEKLRSMSDQTSKAAEDQLRFLEGVKNLLMDQRRLRVRRETIVLAVRG